MTEHTLGNLALSDLTALLRTMLGYHIRRCQLHITSYETL